MLPPCTTQRVRQPPPYLALGLLEADATCMQGISAQVWHIPALMHLSVNALQHGQNVHRHFLM